MHHRYMSLPYIELEFVPVYEASIFFVDTISLKKCRTKYKTFLFLDTLTSVDKRVKHYFLVMDYYHIKRSFRISFDFD